MASNTSDSNDMQSLSIKTENDVPSSSSVNGSNPSSPVPEPAGNLGSTLNGLASDFFEDYTSTLPDPIIKYYLNSAGCESSDTKVIRLIALVAEKFIADIANDALQHCKMRGAGQSSKKATKDKRYVLSTEDLTPALADYGINGKKPHYFV